MTTNETDRIGLPRAKFYPKRTRNKCSFENNHCGTAMTKCNFCKRYFCGKHETVLWLDGCHFDDFPIVSCCNRKFCVLILFHHLSIRDQHAKMDEKELWNTVRGNFELHIRYGITYPKGR